MLRPGALETRWLVPSFPTGDGKHLPLPLQPDGKVAEQLRNAATNRGCPTAMGEAASDYLLNTISVLGLVVALVSSSGVMRLGVGQGFRPARVDAGRAGPGGWRGRWW